jgi:predicted TIM-barrel fold metal-dependent hydrolase
MDAAGVDAAIIHPPRSDPRCDEIAAAAVVASPKRFAVLGWLPPDRPEGSIRLPHWRDQPGMLGLRFRFRDASQLAWLTDGTMDWLWRSAEDADIPVALQAAAFLPRVRSVAERHPRLRLLIDGMGRAAGRDYSGRAVGPTDAAAFANFDELIALARFPNVSVKVSGAPSYSSAGYPWRNIHVYIRRIFDSFGPGRMFWGTDLTRMPCSLRECVTMFTEEMPWLAGDDLELVMGKALSECLGWHP